MRPSSVSGMPITDGVHCIGICLKPADTMRCSFAVTYIRSFEALVTAWASQTPSRE